MRFAMLFLLCTIGLLGADDQYNRGEMLFLSGGCTGCHGPDAEGSSQYPRLANRDQQVLRHQLYYYRKGSVSSQSAEIMVQFSMNLSDANIEDLSYFLSQHKDVKKRAVSSDLLGGFGS